MTPKRRGTENVSTEYENLINFVHRTVENELKERGILIYQAKTYDYMPGPNYASVEKIRSTYYVRASQNSP